MYMLIFIPAAVAAIIYGLVGSAIPAAVIGGIFLCAACCGHGVQLLYEKEVSTCCFQIPDH